MESKEMAAVKMELEKMRKQLEIVTNLLALGLRSNGVSAQSVGKAMGVTGQRVSQLVGEIKTRVKSK